jgi:hypothetical protein
LSGARSTRISSTTARRTSTCNSSIKNVSIAFTENGKTVLTGNLSRNSSSNGLVPGKPISVTGYVTGKASNVGNLEHQCGLQVIAPPTDRRWRCSQTRQGFRRR